MGSLNTANPRLGQQVQRVLEFSLDSILPVPQKNLCHQRLGLSRDGIRLIPLPPRLEFGVFKDVLLVPSLASVFFGKVFGRLLIMRCLQRIPLVNGV